jgi:hypothetical protein
MPSFRLTRGFLVEVAHQVYSLRGHVVLLVRTETQGDRLADRFRKILLEEFPLTTRGSEPPLLRPTGANPSFVSLFNGGWCLFHPITDLDADDDVGHVQFVYWPTEGGNYEKVDYEFWRKERQQGHVFRPLLVMQTKAPSKKGPRTAWDRILEDDWLP